MKPGACVIPLLVLCLAGCAQYAPAPLDFPADAAEWMARSPTSGEVAAYARSLAGRDPSTPRYDPSDGLTLAEAEIVALFFNPTLRAARLKAKVPLASAEHAGRWEDPELVVDAERILQSVEDPWVLGGVLNFTLPLSGRLGMEKAKALAEADVEELRALAEERKIIADLRERWLAWSMLRERVRLTEGHVAALDTAVGTAERLRQAGELSPIDARLLRIERVRQAGELQSLRARARSEELSIKSLMGLAPTADLLMTPCLSIPASEGTPDWPALLRHHAQTRIAAAEYEVAERALALEVRKSRPDLKVGGGFGTDEGDSRVLFGFALPLPIFNANRQAIAQAYAGREVARASARAVFEDLLAQGAQAQAKLGAARARVDFVEKELAPLADQQLEDARRLGRLGDAATLVLLEALKSAHEARLEALDARLELSLAKARLSSLTENSPSHTKP
jgi:outer membrane protein TolC